VPRRSQYAMNDVTSVTRSPQIRSAWIGSEVFGERCELETKMSRTGFTLVEALMAIVVVGLVSLIALPRFQEAMATTNLRGARTKVASLYAKTRAVAIESSRISTLRVEGGRIYIIAQPRRQPGVGTIDTITRPEDLSIQYGVGLTPNGDIRVAPTGLGLDAGTLILTKGVHVDTVSISRFGQVVK
jgi:prepilin-type N-terminal cleavage/methylation domain-containing protein